MFYLQITEKIANIGGMIFASILCFIMFIGILSEAIKRLSEYYYMSICKECVIAEGRIKRFIFIKRNKKIIQYPVVETIYNNKQYYLKDETCIDHPQFSRVGDYVKISFNLKKYPEKCFIVRKSIDKYTWVLYFLFAFIFLAGTFFFIYNLFMGNILNMGRPG